MNDKLEEESEKRKEESEKMKVKKNYILDLI